jgi:hypothetical protein
MMLWCLTNLVSINEAYQIGVITILTQNFPITLLSSKFKGHHNLYAAHSLHHEHLFPLLEKCLNRARLFIGILFFVYFLLAY